MGKNEKNNYIKVILEIIKKIDFGKLSSASIFNLIFSGIIALVIVLLSAVPILSLVESLVTAIGNIAIRLFTDKQIITSESSGGAFDVILSLAFLIVEMVICKIYCFKAKSN